MRALPRSAVLAMLACAAACNETIDDLRPVGGTTATDAEIERFVRRLHLDLAGAPPSDAALEEARGRVASAGNSTAIRRTLAEELVATAAFADTWVSELENQVYGGQTLETHYDFVCAVVRAGPPCDTCAPPGTGQNPCENCNCPVLVDLAAERASLATAATDLAAGTSTSAIGRRYADTDGFRALLGGPEGTATTLIEVYLGRTPQAEEIENAARMINGPLIPGSPAGLLYHRHGSSYADLLDIVFSDEIYREAVVTAAFERFLGRAPTPDELRHFVTFVDATDPDQRPVILALTSSREYFQP
jgi:hypothetical protein